MEQQPLAAVRLVCGGQSPLAALTHVLSKINAFVFEESDGRWTLESASKRGFLGLLDRLLKHEWLGFNQHCRELRLQFAIKHSIEAGTYDAHVLEWWLKTYMPEQTQYPMDQICLFGIVHGRLDVLQWVHQELQGQLSVPINTQSPEVYCRSPEVIRWLHANGGRQLRLTFVFEPKCLETKDSLEALKWCLAHEDREFLTIQDPELALAEAIYTGHLELLQWLHQHRPERCSPSVLSEIVSDGHLHVAEWLQANYPQHYFSDLKWKYGGIRAMSHSDLAAIRWGVSEFNWRDEKAQLVWVTDAMKIAAHAGDLDMLASLEDIREKILKSRIYNIANGSNVCDDAIGSALHQDIAYWAAINGQQTILQWLENHLKDLQSPQRATEAVFHAAANGHLDCLKWLHQHRPEGAWRRRSMNVAAANGHLEVVRWMHETSTEGCSVSAMDRAAKYGRLEVVQWLHKNRTEGCTTAAMDMAVHNGHLEVVKWLHENRAEGCTTDAMDLAAGQGQLHVFQFLHSNRSEGCTARAKALAAEHGHLETFKWLFENRSEGYESTNRNSESIFRKYSSGQLDVIEFMARHRLFLSLGKLMYILINHGRFEAVESILCDAQAIGGVVSIDQKYFDSATLASNLVPHLRIDVLLPLLSIRVNATAIPPDHVALPSRERIQH